MTHIKELREIVLDTETTGLYAKSGDRIIEIGCVELINRVRTGKTFHTYLNPMRDVPMESFQVHGISTQFLQDKPKFSKIVKEFLEFIGNGSTLIIHNAVFDIGFINAELALCGMQNISLSRALCTLTMARKKNPGLPASLDALCKRMGISLESRKKHGALTDAELLALVYIELAGGNQSSLGLNFVQESINAKFAIPQSGREFRGLRHFPISDNENAAHGEFLQKINNSIWNKKS